MGSLKIFAVNLICMIVLVVGETPVFDLEYVGCYDSDYVLEKHYSLTVNSNHLVNCMIACKFRGSTRYIGIDSGFNNCYCGDDIAEMSTHKRDNQCNTRCAEDSSRTCGGTRTTGLFRRGPGLISVYRAKTNNKLDASKIAPFLTTLTSEARVYKSSKKPDYNTLIKPQNSEYDMSWNSDYHYAKKLVFTHSKNKLTRVDVSPTFAKTSTPTVIRNLADSCQGYGFAVDWVADKIYWVDCDSEGHLSVMKMNLDGSNSEKVKTVEGRREIKRMEVDPHKGMIFWLADSKVESFNVNSKEYHNDISQESNVKDFSIDRSAQKVYFMTSTDFLDGGDVTLFGTDYSGKNKVKVLSVPEMAFVRSMAVHGGFVYWDNNEYYRGLSMSTSVIYRAPVHADGTGGHGVEPVKYIDQNVVHIRIIHPDIQATQH